MNEFLNFSYNALNLLDNKFHKNIEGTLIDSFIHELQDSLKLQEANSILEKIPRNANLHFAKFEENYAVCFDYSSKTVYNIPKSYIKGKEPEIGDAIKAISSKDFRIDSTGIPVNPKDIDTLLNECTYATISSKLAILPEYYKISNIGIDFAICKNQNTNKIEHIPIDEIPKSAKDGDTLIYKNGSYYIKNRKIMN